MSQDYENTTNESAAGALAALPIGVQRLLIAVAFVSALMALAFALDYLRRRTSLLQKTE